jgi:hypothetical protein
MRTPPTAIRILATDAASEPPSLAKSWPADRGRATPSQGPNALRRAAVPSKTLAVDPLLNVIRALARSELDDPKVGEA